MSEGKLEILELNSLTNLNQKEEDWKVIEKKESQKRVTLFHYVVHLLAIFIVISYILLIVWRYDIPKEFSTIVSIIIGFYFAKSLFNNKN